MLVLLFFFNDTATTEIYTLSLHDALPISPRRHGGRRGRAVPQLRPPVGAVALGRRARPDRQHGRLEPVRSEEHTSELQSRQYLVCRLLLEKKKNKNHYMFPQLTIGAHRFA